MPLRLVLRNLNQTLLILYLLLTAKIVLEIFLSTDLFVRQQR